jgi:NAD(P)-dependent dehydrogenase (short-subunit alcohol dehydrogenase family)
LKDFLHVPIVGGEPVPGLAEMLLDMRFNLPVLINADATPDGAAIIARSTAFAEGRPASLIVTLIRAAAPGLEEFSQHEAAAILWAFTRQAALAWAPRRIRVNAVGIGAAPFGPFEADDQAGRAAAPCRAEAAGLADIAATLCAIADLPSMTGQIIRLGA